MTNPWAELPPALSPTELSARRVSGEHHADFFWARDSQGRCMLILQYSIDFPPDVRLPSLRGVAVIRANADSGLHHLRFVLEDAALRDIFAELCRDIVEATVAEVSEASVIQAAVLRTWRWHHLLKGRGGQLLTEERQKGLIGELLLIETVADRLPLDQIVDSWRGPLGAPKDFIIPASIGVECKAVRGVEVPFVRISSEWQLDTDQLEQVFLSVVTVVRSVASEMSSLTLTMIVDRVRNFIVERSPGALHGYEAALYAVGYRPEDDYREYWWKIDEIRYYHVRPDFPRIEGSMLPQGLARVTYDVHLGDCRPFILDRQEFLNRLASNPNE
jgi:hypothetical protein